MLESNAQAENPEKLAASAKRPHQTLQELSDIEDNEDILERFIPISEEDIIETLSNASVWTAEQSNTFRRVCNILVALYHAHFHDHLRQLKASYLPFSPDRDTVIVKEISEEERLHLLDELVANIDKVCERANFERLDEEALNEAMAKSSPYGVEVYVNFEEFHKMALYYRGSAIRHSKIRNWKWLWLRKKDIETPIYRRLFLMLKPSEEQESVANNKDVDERCVYIKLFKNIPQYDLETLFPNTQIKMSLFDKIKLTVTGGGGTITGIAAFIAKAGTASFTGLFLALGGLAAVIWRQIANVFSHRTKYMATLAKNLYFYNLNNNMGAISQVVDMAEGEDTKEALLAYYFLSAHGEENFTEASLDARIEAHVKEAYGVSIDFEVSDGLRKLDNLDLLIRQSDGTLQVKGLDETLKKLNDDWDEMYDYK